MSILLPFLRNLGDNESIANCIFQIAFVLKMDLILNPNEIVLPFYQFLIR